MNFEIKKRTEVEQVAYLMGMYFTGAITLIYLKIQLNAIEETHISSTTAS